MHNRPISTRAKEQRARGSAKAHLGLQHATARIGIRVHLNGIRVDGGINHHPGPTAQLRPGWQVHEDGLRVYAQVVDNHGAKLKDLHGSEDGA